MSDNTVLLQYAVNALSEQVEPRTIVRTQIKEIFDNSGVVIHVHQLYVQSGFGDVHWDWATYIDVDVIDGMAREEIAGWVFRQFTAARDALARAIIGNPAYTPLEMPNAGG